MSGNIAVDEMRRTFNCGVGMIVVVDDTAVAAAIEVLVHDGEIAWKIGRVADGPGEVCFL